MINGPKDRTHVIYEPIDVPPERPVPTVRAATHVVWETLDAPTNAVRATLSTLMPPTLDWRWSDRYEPTEVLSGAGRISLGVITSSLNGVPYETEAATFNNGGFRRISETSGANLKHCQDAAALSCDTKGNVKEFCFTDGASEAVKGRVSALAAASLGIRAVQATNLDRNTVGQMIQGIQDVLHSNTDLQALRAQWAEEIMRRHDLLPALRESRLEDIGYSGESGTLTKVGAGVVDKKLSATTFISGKIERDLLKVARVGDMCYLVANRKGIKAFSKGPLVKNAQLNLGGGRIPPENIEYDEIQLDPEDVVILCSDGLLYSKTREKISMEKRAAQVVDYLKRGYTVDQIIQMFVEDAAGHDDVVALGIKHQNS